MKLISEKGFTLMETLVAVALLSLVSIALATVFRSAINGYRFASIQARLDVKAEMIIGRFHKDLQNVVLFTPVPFEGTAHSLSFAAILPANTPEGPIVACHTVVTFVDTGGDGSGLLRISAPFCRRIMDSTQLSDEADTIHFSYGEIDEKGNMVWTESWNADENRYPPKAVKLKLTVTQSAGDMCQSRNIEEIMYMNVTAEREKELDETAS